MTNCRPRTRFSPSSIRDIVRKRAGNRCEACGIRPARNPGGKTRGTIHHRHPRRLGGIDSVENMVLLCYPCHRDVHKDEPFASASGFLSWVDPSCVPVLHARAGWALLVPDGSFEPLDEGEALALLDFVNGVTQAS